MSVFGVPDERLGEIPVAVIHAPNAFNEDDLRDFLDGRLARFKIPGALHPLGRSTPAAGTGKIDRRALKARYAR